MILSRAPERIILRLHLVTQKTVVYKDAFLLSVSENEVLSLKTYLCFAPVTICGFLYVVTYLCCLPDCHMYKDHEIQPLKMSDDENKLHSI